MEWEVIDKDKILLFSFVNVVHKHEVFETIIQSSNYLSYCSELRGGPLCSNRSGNK